MPRVRVKAAGPRRLLWCVPVLLLWAVLLGAWTAALLTPDPVRLAQEVLPEPVEFPAAKLLHLGAYAALAALGCVLRPLGRFRWVLLVVLSLHGMGTEYCQQFIPLRGPSVRDVLIDHAGIFLGALAVWLWRMKSTHLAGELARREATAASKLAG
jgi:VanZ family protein